MKNIFTPPKNITTRDRSYPSIFLGGTIDMGNSENWQKKLSESLLLNGYNVFNPRREDYDSSWTQEFTNPQFSQQVNWELNAMDNSDIILFYFKKDSQSPITLLELGLYANSGKVLVVCEDGFWRKGNVDIVCSKYNIPLYSNLEYINNYVDDFRKNLIL